MCLLSFLSILWRSLFSFHCSFFHDPFCCCWAQETKSFSLIINHHTHKLSTLKHTVLQHHLKQTLRQASLNFIAEQTKLHSMALKMSLTSRRRCWDGIDGSDLTSWDALSTQSCELLLVCFNVTLQLLKRGTFFLASAVPPAAASALSSCSASLAQLCSSCNCW